MVVCVFIINAFKKKNNGYTLKAVKRFQNDVGYYNDITEVIQQAIANGRPQKEIEALQKGQKTVLDKIRNLVYEDKGLDAVLKLEEEKIEKKW